MEPAVRIVGSTVKSLVLTPSTAVFLFLWPTVPLMGLSPISWTPLFPRSWPLSLLLSAPFTPTVTMAHTLPSLTVLTSPLIFSVARTISFFSTILSLRSRNLLSSRLRRPAALRSPPPRQRLGLALRKGSSARTFSSWALTFTLLFFVLLCFHLSWCRSWCRCLPWKAARRPHRLRRWEAAPWGFPTFTITRPQGRSVSTSSQTQPAKGTDLPEPTHQQVGGQSPRTWASPGVSQLSRKGFSSRTPKAPTVTFVGHCLPALLAGQCHQTSKPKATTTPKTCSFPIHPNSRNDFLWATWNKDGCLVSIGAPPCPPPPHTCTSCA